MFSPTVAEANDLDEPAGVLVVDVRLGPASGGFKGCRGTRVVRGQEVPVGGDVIVGIADRPVRSHEALMRYLITETEPDESVTVQLIRDGERIDEELTLGEHLAPGTDSNRQPRARPGDSDGRSDDNNRSSDGRSGDNDRSDDGRDIPIRGACPSSLRSARPRRFRCFGGVDPSQSRRNDGFTTD